MKDNLEPGYGIRIDYLALLNRKLLLYGKRDYFQHDGAVAGSRKVDICRNMGLQFIAFLAILASFPLLPQFGIILPPSTPILMAIALQTSCIYRASSIDLRKSGNAVFYHS